MSLLGEIKRRKVFQVAVAYAIVGWLLIEVASVLLPTFQAPEWVMRAFSFAVIAGFPLAVILAWAFDLTPEGIKAASEIGVDRRPTQLAGNRVSYITQGLILLAVGFLVVDQYVLNPGPVASSTSDPQTVTAFQSDSALGLGKPLHVLVALPEGTHLAVDTEYPTIALSPDGLRLVFVAEDNGIRQLYMRDLADLEAHPIVGTEGAAGPFFSPDGTWIGFFDGGDFKRVATDGGVPMTVRHVTGTNVSRGATWTVNDTVVIVHSADQGLSQFSIEEAANFPLEYASYTLASAWPDALPNGEDVLFTDTSAGRLEDAVVAVRSFDTGDIKPLVNGSTSPRYSPTGHILYTRGGTLYAAPFDAPTTEVTGPEFELVDGVLTGANGASQFSVAADGTLAYVTGPSSIGEHELVWVDRDGTTETLLDNGRRFFHPRLSPDGNSLALMSPTGPSYDIWVFDLERGNLARWTTHPREDFGPVWGPNGRLAFSSEIGTDFGEEGPGMAWMSGPSQPPEHLLRTPGDGNWDFPTDWSPDGRWLLFSATRNRTTHNIYLLETESLQVEAFLETPFEETSARFSPDGEWVAYVSDQTGRREVYVRSFASQGDVVQMSTNGGEEPVWSRDGGELFYREGPEGERLMVITLGADPTLSASAPQLLFEGQFEETIFGGQNSNYDVSPDGRRFVMVRPKNPVTPTAIHLVLNWPETLGVPAR